MLLAYSLLGGSALILIRHDIQTQTIPLYTVLMFVLAALLKQFWEPNIEGFLAAGIIALIWIGCQGSFYLFKRGLAMGWGDLLLGPFCGMWLYLHELPSFFLSTGLVALFMGLLWYYKWDMQTFPMVPAILSGLGVVLLMRCY